MILQALAFWVFAAVTVVSAFMVVSSRNPVYSVLFLILAFFNSAALFVLIGAEFVAMILVIVYVGAVAVLFLFVVMMLDINIDSMRKGFWNHFPLAATLGAVIALGGLLDIRRVAETLAESGAEILISINGSPFEAGKQDTRIALAVRRVVETGLPFVFCAQVCGQDELVFEGASFVLNADRGLAVQMPNLAPGRSWDTTPMWGIPRVDRFPYTGSALVEWDYGTPAPPIVNLPNRAGQDPHGLGGREPRLGLQVAYFLEGVLIDACGGGPCVSSVR